MLCDFKHFFENTMEVILVGADAHEGLARACKESGTPVSAASTTRGMLDAFTKLAELEAAHSAAGAEPAAAARLAVVAVPPAAGEPALASQLRGLAARLHGACGVVTVVDPADLGWLEAHARGALLGAVAPPARASLAGKALGAAAVADAAAAAALRACPDPAVVAATATSAKGGAGATVLVVGSGGREHAIALALAASPRVAAVRVAPGNGGTATSSAKVTNEPALGVGDLDAIVAYALRENVALVAVGPEDPLCAGLADKARVDRGSIVRARTAACVSQQTRPPRQMRDRTRTMACRVASGCC